MAVQVTLSRTSDMGSGEQATRLARFAWNGEQWEIDLSDGEHEELAAVLDRYAEHARRIAAAPGLVCEDIGTVQRDGLDPREAFSLATAEAGRPAKTTAKPAKATAAAPTAGLSKTKQAELRAARNGRVRAWAAENLPDAGLREDGRGRIPQSVMAAYAKARPSDTA